MTNVIVAPFVPPEVQTLVVVELNETVNPDEAVALTVIGPWSKRSFDSAPKVIVWLPGLTVKALELTVLVTPLMPLGVAVKV